MSDQIPYKHMPMDNLDRSEDFEERPREYPVEEDGGAAATRCVPVRRAMHDARENMDGDAGVSNSSGAWDERDTEVFPTAMEAPPPPPMMYYPNEFPEYGPQDLTTSSGYGLAPEEVLHFQVTAPPNAQQGAQTGNSEDGMYPRTYSSSVTLNEVWRAINSLGSAWDTNGPTNAMSGYHGGWVPPQPDHTAVWNMPSGPNTVSYPTVHTVLSIPSTAPEMTPAPGTSFDPAAASEKNESAKKKDKKKKKEKKEKTTQASGERPPYVRRFIVRAYRTPSTRNGSKGKGSGKQGNSKSSDATRHLSYIAIYPSLGAMAVLMLPGQGMLAGAERVLQRARASRRAALVCVKALMLLGFLLTVYLLFLMMTNIFEVSRCN